uniref:Uncharacterized protein n=1 Tax=Zhangjiakou Rhabd tick virus 2 TaxID=2972335 RepID=A0A9E7V2D0_9RHAB|nr:MAG: hypothetical protein [Zhangjiakou Rhabd tick virus 2]
MSRFTQTSLTSLPRSAIPLGMPKMGGQKSPGGSSQCGDRSPGRLSPPSSVCSWGCGPSRKGFLSSVRNVVNLVRGEILRWSHGKPVNFIPMDQCITCNRFA